MSREVYELVVLDYQKRLETIRSVNDEEYTELYTKFVEDVVQFCKRNDLTVDGTMIDIELFYLYDKEFYTKMALSIEGSV
jgi:Leu/Phe-tRNA-protein transferase